MLVGLPTPDLRPDVAFCPQKAEFHLHFEDCFGAPMSNAKARHPQITPYVSQALEPSQESRCPECHKFWAREDLGQELMGIFQFPTTRCFACAHLPVPARWREPGRAGAGSMTCGRTLTWP
jgi:hypothetical protein